MTSNVASLSVLSLCAISITILSSSLPRAVSQQCNEDDKAALLRIKNSFGYSPLQVTWDPSTDCCHGWNLVDCDFTGRIYSLWLADSNTTGPIPSSIGDFPNLQYLNIVGNPTLSGTIPDSMSKLRSLQKLTISGSSISGNIPTFLCDLPYVHSFDLSKNDLSGPIPDCFASRVNVINLNHNRLSGSIPPSLFNGYTGSDIEFHVQGNQLCGQIPQSFSALSFSYLDLSANHFSGDASVVLGESKLSENIDLSDNEFEFDLSPVTYPSEYLSYFNISHNRIYGSINQQITELNVLGVLDMSYNRLCGPIPSGGLMRPYEEWTFAHNECLCDAPLPPCGDLVSISVA